MKKMSLYQLDLSRLQHSEVGAFIARIITDFNNLSLATATEPDFMIFFTYLVTLSPSYNLALNQVLASAESKHLLELDRIRDRKIGNLKKAFSIHNHSDVAANQLAYDFLKPLFTTYKNVARLNFETESLELTMFIGKLLDATNHPKVVLLGLQSYVLEMQTANENFKTAFSNRSTTTNTTQVYDVAKMRKEILLRYKNWTNFVYSMEESKDSPFFTAVCTMNNKVRSYYANIIATRNGGPTETPVTPIGG